MANEASRERDARGARVYASGSRYPRTFLKRPLGGAARALRFADVTSNTPTRTRSDNSTTIALKQK